MTYDECKFCIFSDCDENWSWYCKHPTVDDLNLIWE